YAKGSALKLPKYQRKAPSKKELVGVDIFVHHSGSSPDNLAKIMQQIEEVCEVKLTMITNRGIKVWPEGFEETFCTDHWRCRFKPADGHILDKILISQILYQADNLKIDTIKTENLYDFDGKPCYALGQGQ
ncbi:hypothetical protein, partial [uncultured Mucilaginibacter sp.]|uniref:hypothetical protein n=1 Tax=uncultured Mucilaginibacter sp. TaxID=797541 RepID=UPI0025ECD281